MAAGLRVIRGPDWNLDDDDGGEGHVGTVVEVGEDGNTEIVWDGGQITMCRGGQGQGHDLRVLDNATVGESKLVYILTSFLIHDLEYKIALNSTVGEFSGCMCDTSVETV